MIGNNKKELTIKINESDYQKRGRRKSKKCQQDLKKACREFDLCKWCTILTKSSTVIVKNPHLNLKTIPISSKVADLKRAPR